MEIKEKRDGEKSELIVKGRLETTTSPSLENIIKATSKSVKELTLNLSEVEYISSAGLRVVLVAHKLFMAAGGKSIIQNPSQFCRQVFEATGMSSVLNIV